MLDIRIEETASVDFDLSDEEDQYVDVGQITGRIVVDYQINRSGLIDRLDRVAQPSVSDRLNMFLEDWSLDGAVPGRVELNYGTLLLEGTNPMDIDNTYDLGDTFSQDRLRSLSPEDLRRQLRTETDYETTYDAIEDEIDRQLEREGIRESVDIPSPIRLQARSNPRVEGTDFTITVENTQPHRIVQATINIEMPAKVGREVDVGHTDGAADTSMVDGRYDPERGVYAIDVQGIPRSTNGGEVEIPFHVGKAAPRSLERLDGEAEFVRETPFSDLNPVAVFDAGGNPLGDESVADVSSRGKITASFRTPVSEITIDQQGDITKKIQVQGVPPGERTIRKIEERIQERGVSGYEQDDITESRNMREGTELTRFQTAFRGGIVRHQGAEIRVTVKVDGERRTAQRESSREADENLPAERKSVTTETGHTGVTITGDGIETDKVDEYVSELRDDLKMTLGSLSEDF
ncbi:hypothetical protein C475_20602 [Halosimplex carlsbadense 2-9-1]|uniref:Uncharacterized protein n=2 Tax=Halosimplex carlsbadense TaxID=171164 RepID=M0CCX2_9EURY|nr:hypothetical protein C475_20602 [Halosimplex carlsbadense 2-9-1]